MNDLVAGVIKSRGSTLQKWARTDPAKGNWWQELAKGQKVFAFPIWLYCDDTCGNSLKKWNKNNSFLFTAAGLPHDKAHQEYNVHFLAMSNIAPPLEIVEGIVEQIKYVQNVAAVEISLTLSKVWSDSRSLGMGLHAQGARPDYTILFCLAGRQSHAE